MENKLNIEIEKYRKRNIHERILKYTNFFYLQKKKKDERYSRHCEESENIQDSQENSNIKMSDIDI